MSKKSYKQRHMDTPVEKHETAPLDNIDGLKPVSKVNLPSEESVDYAKGWVDMNEK